MEPLPYPCKLREEILAQKEPVDTVSKMWDFAVQKRRGQVEGYYSVHCIDTLGFQIQF